MSDPIAYVEPPHPLWAFGSGALLGEAFVAAAYFLQNGRPGVAVFSFAALSVFSWAFNEGVHRPALYLAGALAAAAVTGGAALALSGDEAPSPAEISIRQDEGQAVNVEEGLVTEAPDGRIYRIDIA